MKFANQVFVATKLIFTCASDIPEFPSYSKFIYFKLFVMWDKQNSGK